MSDYERAMKMADNQLKKLGAMKLEPGALERGLANHFAIPNLAPQIEGPITPRLAALEQQIPSLRDSIEKMFHDLLQRISRIEDQIG